MSELSVPGSAEELTVETLDGLIARDHPGTRVARFELSNIKRYGQEMVSSAGRANVRLEFAYNPENLPKEVLMKLAREDLLPAPLYENEVAFYRILRPELHLATPRSLGGAYDSATGNFALLLEDLGPRDPHFPNVLDHISVDRVEGLLDLFAELHAGYWDTPRWSGDLAVIQSHVDGHIFEFFEKIAPGFVAIEVENDSFKKEMVAALGTDVPEMWAGLRRVQRYQSTGPLTMLHGDAHLGNTYALGDGSVGLLDWQLAVRGNWAHDVHYLINTALPVDVRREHEVRLLKRYLAKLSAFGVASPPSWDTAWYDYRLALIWGFFIGWLITPRINYGPGINQENVLRMKSAMADHDTMSLVRELVGAPERVAS
ncbi:phosphotransferase [Sphingosinicella soli]|uniref:CHK kinase-like domain-containing protein n=1 Tax=Sphingosinicella soli TaxID=333708 RepID=A0A7W7B0X5_9SPHN|nr:phosphotransferase [Sphingosinicella soli]MBB4632005.1 hypothetical protein [Sphingosinicella soli]